MASSPWWWSSLALLLVATALVNNSSAQTSTATVPTVPTTTITSATPSTTTLAPTSTLTTVTTSAPTSASTAAPAPATILRHLQVVFRHGDRAPLFPLFPNDPFNKRTDWPHGLDQLTNNGRARMFRLGQMIRAKYGDYLGQDFSPREIYARSSAIDRCLESAQLVLAGSYPPNSSFWQWDINGAPLPLAKIWQPIPVASFLPPNDDSLLRTKRPCPNAEAERANILNSPTMKALMKEHQGLLDEISQVSGLTVDTILEADRFHENLIIEHENNYYWSDRMANQPNTTRWTKQHEIDIVRQLKPFAYARWNNEWNSTIIKRVRAGELLTAISDNFFQKKSILDLENQDQNKLVLFSTHDTKVAALLFALDVWNGIFIPYSTAIIFELHQSIANQTEFYVAVRYYNETMSLLDSMNSTTNFKDSHPLLLPQCAAQSVTLGSNATPLCPLDRFIEIVGQFKITDWNAECGIDSQYSSSTYLSTINALLLVANLAVMGVLLLLVMYFVTKIRSRPGYQRLE